MLVLHRALNFPHRSQLQFPTITHLISHSSLLPSFPCLISPFPCLCWTPQIIYLYWNLGLGDLLQGVPTPRQTLNIWKRSELNGSAIRVPREACISSRWERPHFMSPKHWHQSSEWITSQGLSTKPSLAHMYHQPGYLHVLWTQHLQRQTTRVFLPGTTLHPPGRPTENKPVSSGKARSFLALPWQPEHAWPVVASLVQMSFKGEARTPCPKLGFRASAGHSHDLLPILDPQKSLLITLSPLKRNRRGHHQRLFNFAGRLQTLQTPSPAQPSWMYSLYSFVKPWGWIQTEHLQAQALKNHISSWQTSASSLLGSPSARGNKAANSLSQLSGSWPPWVISTTRAGTFP